MSCSLFRLWIMDPEHKNSIALKNAWVQICRKARWGWFKPTVTIINPSWLDVENATIFLISFCVIAHIAVNSVVNAPKHNEIVRIVWLFSSIGWNRISRKIPATTIVLEWSKADTGVGPSIAEGSQGWRLNCADFPVAAIINPKSAIGFMFMEKICWRSHELQFNMSQAIVNINPISPIRLYRIACRAAVLASDRPYHHPISRNDMIPTPSHPINNWNKLFADTRIIMVKRKIVRYLKNREMLGSECIYHRENSKIAQVTNRAIGIKIIEKKSILKLIEKLNEWIENQCQLVMIDSWPLYKKVISGNKLIVKASIIIFLQYSGKLIFLGKNILYNKGIISNIIVNIEVVFKILITFIWSCTKVFGS